MFLTERFERIRSWIYYPFPESYYPVIIVRVQLYHRSISPKDLNHWNPRDRKPKDKASKTLKKFKFYGELSFFLSFSSKKEGIKVTERSKMYQYEVDLKIAQNVCERDSSRLWICTLMPKWPIYLSLFEGPFLSWGIPRYLEYWRWQNSPLRKGGINGLFCHRCAYPCALSFSRQFWGILATPCKHIDTKIRV